MMRGWTGWRRSRARRRLRGWMRWRGWGGAARRGCRRGGSAPVDPLPEGEGGAGLGAQASSGEAVVTPTLVDPVGGLETLVRRVGGPNPGFGAHPAGERGGCRVVLFRAGGPYAPGVLPARGGRAAPGGPGAVHHGGDRGAVDLVGGAAGPAGRGAAGGRGWRRDDGGF